jgi:hypothetical protein
MNEKGLDRPHSDLILADENAQKWGVHVDYAGL